MAEKIIIGSDHGGFNLKIEIIKHLEELGYEVSDLGCYSKESCDYPLIAKSVAEKVLDSNSRGILICGTGIGVSIAANRYKGIRAALLYDDNVALMTRKHNDANVMVFGGRTMNKEDVFNRIDIFLNTEFEGGRHQKRIDMLDF